MGGGGDYQRATTAVAAKSTVSHPPLSHRHPTTHSPSSRRPDGNSFPARALSADGLLDGTGWAQWGLSGRKYWHPVVLNLTHIHRARLDGLVSQTTTGSFGDVVGALWGCDLLIRFSDSVFREAEVRFHFQFWCAPRPIWLWMLKLTVEDTANYLLHKKTK